VARDREWALNQLRHKRQAFILTLTAMYLINSPDLEAVRGKRILLLPSGLVFNPDSHEYRGDRYLLELTQVVDERTYKRSDFDYTLGQFYLFNRRNFLNESLETVEVFAASVGARNDLLKEHWYDFGKIVRNALSHNFMFSLRDYKKKLPVLFGSKIIEWTMNGQEVTQDIIDPVTLMDIHRAMVSFVNAH